MAVAAPLHERYESRSALFEVGLCNSPSVPQLTVGKAVNDQMWRAVERRFWELASELDEIERAHDAGEIDLKELLARCRAVFVAIEALNKTIGPQLPEE